MTKVGVIGAGVMGSGVAQNLAQFGFETILIDLNEIILNKARDEIIKASRFQAFYNRNNKTLIEPEEVINRIQFTTDYELLKDVDFVIENVTEKWSVKKEIYSIINGICPAHCIFVVNTSCISITKIGSLTDRPERVIGIHFMNPVPLKHTVEVIQSFHTSEDTIYKALELLKKMGKEGILVKDMPGFVSNRVLMLTINEAAFAVQDQVASPEDVDRIFRECFGHKMGPLATADMIGLDTILYSIEVLYESYSDSKYRPCPLLRKMVDAGLYGVKSSRGFYQYGQD